MLESGSSEVQRWLSVHAEISDGSNMLWRTSVTTVVGLVLVTMTLPFPAIEGANILGIFLSHSPSHQIVHMSIIKALAEQGHNVTVVTSIEPKVDHSGIRKILIPPTDEEQTKLHNILTKMSMEKNSIISTLGNFLGPFSVMYETQFTALQDPRFTRLYDTKFDLVIGGFFFNDFQLAVAAKFKCPFILSWSAMPMNFVNAYIGNPSEVAYVYAYGSNTKMNFLQRVENYITNIAINSIRILLDYRMEGFYNQLIGHNKKDEYPTYYEMKKDVSLLFCNSHYSEGAVRPNTPAVVEIGGIQIKEQADPLPKDIAEFMDAAKEHGVIFFSLGSNVKCSNLPPEIAQSMYETLASLKQHVIWKWDDVSKVPGNASNILYGNWLPQDDILAHPNTRLFVTHAGKGGVSEAQYHAVPMLAIPLFADQPTNAQQLVDAGYGLQLDMKKLTTTNFKQSLLEVINNPVYAENVKRFSQLYRDRPMTAKQSVVYWTEYVIRHGGAAHIKSPVLDLNFFQSHSWDVIGLIAAVLYAVSRLLKLTCQLLCRKCCSKAAPKAGAAPQKTSTHKKKVKSS